ncbi:MAG: RNA-binding S4 domain-containing protein [Gammaproteobacteria bacterium]|nr:RNA-binding S4 domain-containing protein [Gammaproteobacteria bacterium]
MNDIELTTQPVELYKILKFAGLVASGGEAKMIIASGQVQVNGHKETRKRKKISAGDIIELGTEKYRVRCSPAAIDKPD